MSNVLVIGDTHCPAMHSKYLPFLKRVAKTYNCKKFVLIGDVVDWHSISYHPTAPSLKNPEREYKLALKQVQGLYRAFPNAYWLIGNHDSLTERKAADLDLPLSVLKDYNHLWDVPRWKVIERYGSVEIDGVIYQHGDKGRGGQNNAAFLNAQDEHRSVVQGHHHAQMGVQYFQNSNHKIFGMQVGCGTDHNHPNMSYATKYTKKPNMGCGVVINGKQAHVISMDL